MTPLKFRAWDNRKQRMSVPFDFCCFDGETFAPNGNWEDVWIYGDNTVVMQSTGLFDKAGKEIFELHEVDHCGYKYRVEWSQPHCAFILREISSGDILVLHDGIELEITREYSPMEKDQAGLSNESLS